MLNVTEADGLYDSPGASGPPSREGSTPGQTKYNAFRVE